MSETIISKTKKECFALLNEMLSDEDKRAITEMEDVFQRQRLSERLNSPV